MTQVTDATTPATSVHRLPGGNRVEIVGESYYRPALSRLVGEAGGNFGATLLWASLVPDPANPYDRNAVKVIIKGEHVGHLDREAAIAFQPVAGRMRELGCEVECAAQIVGVKGVFGVALDLGTPDECLECLAVEGETP